MEIPDHVALVPKSSELVHRKTGLDLWATESLECHKWTVMGHSGGSSRGQDDDRNVGKESQAQGVPERNRDSIGIPWRLFMLYCSKETSYILLVQSPGNVSIVEF